LQIRVSDKQPSGELIMLLLIQFVSSLYLLFCILLLLNG
jgi:hypothetical protein